MIQLINDKVLVLPDKPDEFKGDIYLPDTVQRKKYRGKIIAVGPGKIAEKTGILIPMQVRVGDTVIYGEYILDYLNLDDVEYHLMTQNDIYAVVSEDVEFGLKSEQKIYGVI